ncbi:MAG: cyclic nucleotide-binding domain-containing protein, partial [Deltaproteobacteria bacterium]|nr:cyclic nucleotide-binding domain-containing protein [Deltaproteobacteria bacterium]
MKKVRALPEAKIRKAITDFLKSFPFFETLTSEELLVAVEHINFLEVEPKTILFREGDDADSVYFVIEGKLDVIKESARKGSKSEYVLISTLSQGRSIGEMSVIDKTPRSATVRVREKAVLASLKADGFDLLLLNHPKVGIKILKGIARLLSMNLRKTSARLAEYMLP